MNSIERSNFENKCYFFIVYSVNRGLIYAAYSLLGELGFGFLHPLQPLIPRVFSLPARPVRYLLSLTVVMSQLNITEMPYWPVRGLHYHTEHPLELTNYLNGWGVNNFTDPSSSWKSMESDFVSFLGEPNSVFFDQ